MIKEHIVIGSLNTTLHDFTFKTEGMNLIINGTHYTNQNNVLVEHDGTDIVIEIPTDDTYYEVWLTEDGISVLSRTDNQEFGELVNPIDRLAWFAVPSGTVSLDDVEINVVVMEDEDKSN